MIMFPNSPDQLSEKDELKWDELSGSDCILVVPNDLLNASKHSNTPLHLYNKGLS